MREQALDAGIVLRAGGVPFRFPAGPVLGRLLIHVAQLGPLRGAWGKSRGAHWENDDTIIGARHQGTILTVAERKSKFFAAACAKRKTKALVGDALRQCMGPHKQRCSTITFDNGREFAGHAEVGAALRADAFFADPYSS